MERPPEATEPSVLIFLYGGVKIFHWWKELRTRNQNVVKSKRLTSQIPPWSFMQICCRSVASPSGSRPPDLTSFHDECSWQKPFKPLTSGMRLISGPDLKPKNHEYVVVVLCVSSPRHCIPVRGEWSCQVPDSGSVFALFVCKESHSGWGFNPRWTNYLDYSGIKKDLTIHHGPLSDDQSHCSRGRSVKQLPLSTLTHRDWRLESRSLLETIMMPCLLLLSLHDMRLVWAGLGHHLEPGLVNDVQQVLGINGKSVSCRQHLFLVVLLEARSKNVKYIRISAVLKTIYICRNMTASRKSHSKGTHPSQKSIHVKPLTGTAYMNCLLKQISANHMVSTGCWWCTMWGIFSWWTLGPLCYYLNTTDYQSIVADHVQPFMKSQPIFRWLLAAG